MTRLRTGVVTALLVMAALLAGCGAGHGSSSRHTVVMSTAAQREAAAVTVIRDWSRALRRGDVRDAAGYFALPSVFANGPVAGFVHTKREAIEVNVSLSCGARLLSVTSYGSYLHAVFELTDRSGPGGGCGAGAGQKGATDFVIAHGHILRWIRAPISERPPQPTTPTQTQTAPTPTTPAGSQTPSQQV